MRFLVITTKKNKLKSLKREEGKLKKTKKDRLFYNHFGDNWHNSPQTHLKISHVCNFQYFWGKHQTLHKLSRGEHFSKTLYDPRARGKRKTQNVEENFFKILFDARAIGNWVTFIIQKYQSIGDYMMITSTFKL